MDRLLSLSNPLKKWRINQDLTLKECAEVIGVSKEAWRRWEVGIDVPTDRNLVKIAQYMGTKPDALLGELQEFQEKLDNTDAA